jgi:hypothetical protein
MEAAPMEAAPIEPAPIEPAPIQPMPPAPLEAPAVVRAIAAEPVLITHEPPPEVRHIEVTPDPAFEAPISTASLEVPHATEPALETTSQPAAEVWSGGADPALVTDIAAMNAFPTKFGVENPEEVPVGIAADVPELQATEVMPAIEAAPEPVAAAAPAVHAVSEDDFEARVARAMSVYEQSMEAEMAALKEPAPVEVAPPFVTAPEPVAEPERAAETAQIPVIHAVPAKIAAIAAEPEPVLPPPVVVSMPHIAPPEPMPVAPVTVVPPPEPVPAVVAPPEPLAVAAPPVTPEPPAVVPEAAAEVARQVAAQIEAEIPAAASAAAAATSGDNHMVATVVHRVMERLKPELIEEIMRELKDKK